jgi:hypothetical protein
VKRIVDVPRKRVIEERISLGGGLFQAWVRGLEKEN